mmetsp:Transcript_59799/g.146853  ORF Transcript_59799/g.146853 Transcript_59799/m.146853 type:complete len:101 (+) Transcript_59799:151-453(+)
MKFTLAAVIVALVGCSSVADAFSVNNVSTVQVQRHHASVLSKSSHMSATGGMDLSGNSWKPDSEKMGSTDTGDYFPEGYNPEEEIAFTSGMGGSQVRSSW